MDKKARNWRGDLPDMQMIRACLLVPLLAILLALVIRFEEGRGVEQNIGPVISPYRQAASAGGGTIWVYSLPVGNGTQGRMLPVNISVARHGLAEARVRLAALDDE